MRQSSGKVQLSGATNISLRRGPPAASAALRLFKTEQPTPGGSPKIGRLSAHRMKRLAVLGNHLPRQCGIATFTSHIADALAAELPDVDTFVLAMNDAGRRHTYPPRVRFEIAEGDLGSYRRAADFLNVNHVDVLSVQHEYGIFGGKAGAHVLALLGELRMPIVTTLHTVLSTPNPAQRAVIDELARLSERLVVMSASGADLLRRVHGISDDQIDLIPHGIPHVPVDAASKDRLGVDGKTVILTFGLLSRDKGIEYVIDALPAILAAHPDTVYIVLGATHPHVVEHEGEAYRLMLEARSQQLGVAGNMIFHNRFVSQDELTEFLSATDIYITPYLQPEQITSGTLAYAVGAGKAVISTPYIYARELLAEGRGVLVPWRDPAAIAKEVIALVSDRDGQRAMCARAAAYGVGMTWPAVARRYAESFERARSGHTHRRRTTFRAQTLAARPAGLPEITLKHVQAMTDDTGMLQHAIFSVPRYDDGYCLDDNARALCSWRSSKAGSDDGGRARSWGCSISRLSIRVRSHHGRFGTSCRIRANGWSLGRRTAMGRRCERSAPSSGRQETRAVRAWPAISSTPPCLRCRPSRAREPGPTRSWASTST